MDIPSKTIELHPLLPNYAVSHKEPHYEVDASVPNRWLRLRNEYGREGMRRSIDGVLLVHEHNHPYVLLLRLGQTFLKLPGGELRSGEGELAGLRRLLSECLLPNNAADSVPWEVAATLGQWWRPNFDSPQYPYCPVHISKPKEMKKVVLIHLPQTLTFSVPKNYLLVAVPLFELYGAAQLKKYGPIISSLPSVLSRFEFNYNDGLEGPATTQA